MSQLRMKTLSSPVVRLGHQHGRSWTVDKGFEGTALDAVSDFSSSIVRDRIYGGHEV